MYIKHINEDNDMFLQTIKGVRKFLNKLDDVFSIVFKQTNKKMTTKVHIFVLDCFVKNKVNGTTYSRYPF